MRKVYLDHTATTPLDTEVFEAMRPYFSETYGNASSIHSFGRVARAALDEARDVIAASLHASAGEIFFVSSGTEADNFALKGAVEASGTRRIVTSNAEHHAVLETCEYLSRHGVDVCFVPVDNDGMVVPEEVERAVTKETGLISIMHGNNEVGTINPLKEIIHRTKRRGLLIHTDAVQTFGKIPVDVREFEVDLLSISAHKIYGPKGIGALYIRKGVTVERLMHGGSQERGRRAGTENVPLAVGFAKAVSLCNEIMASEARRLQTLKDRLQQLLLAQFPFILLNGSTSSSLPNIVNVSFDYRKIHIDSEALLFNLDLAGIAVTSGSACTSGSVDPSHVLLAMGREPETAKATIRFSLGRSTTEDDLVYTVEELKKIVHRIGHLQGRG